MTQSAYIFSLFTLMTMCCPWNRNGVWFGSLNYRSTGVQLKFLGLLEFTALTVEAQIHGKIYSIKTCQTSPAAYCTSRCSQKNPCFANKLLNVLLPVEFWSSLGLTRSAMLLGNYKCWEHTKCTIWRYRGTSVGLGWKLLWVQADYSCRPPWTNQIQTFQNNTVLLAW